MIGKCCVAAVLLFAGTAAAQTSTTLDVPIVVTHGALSSCANGPTISVDNPAPAAGSTIN